MPNSQETPNISIETERSLLFSIQFFYHKQVKNHVTTGNTPPIYRKVHTWIFAHTCTHVGVQTHEDIYLIHVDIRYDNIPEITLSGGFNL